MLSFVAGIVNINGVLSIGTLTTNVTGHFAFFAEDFVRGDYPVAARFVIYVLFFLMGAFVCGLLVEWALRRNPDKSHALPMFLEMLILVVVAFSGKGFHPDPTVIACALLFSMGLQNALVTRISRATVRTTHLTGLFTDLGIELSQLFFYRKESESQTLSRSIYLRMVIIVFFFMGGVLGGFLFYSIGLQALLFAAGALAIAMVYDNIRFRVRHYARKIRARRFLL